MTPKRNGLARRRGGLVLDRASAALRPFARSLTMRFPFSMLGVLGLLVGLSGCATPPDNPYVPPDRPGGELAVLDWGGGVWGGSRAPDVTSIDAQPVAPQFLASSTSVIPGAHTIAFRYSVYRGLYAIPAHSYHDRTLTFTAEAGHTYRVYTDCGTLGSTACASWIEDKTADIVVAGSLPRWADRDLAMRSHAAAVVRRRRALFQDQLSAVCAGDRPASDVALYYLAVLAPLEQSDPVTAYTWYKVGAARGEEDVLAPLAALERELSLHQRELARQAAAAPLESLCAEGAQRDPGETVSPAGPAEDM